MVGSVCCVLFCCCWIKSLIPAESVSERESGEESSQHSARASTFFCKWWQYRLESGVCACAPPGCSAWCLIFALARLYAAAGGARARELVASSIGHLGLKYKNQSKKPGRPQAPGYQLTVLIGNRQHGDSVVWVWKIRNERQSPRQYQKIMLRLRHVQDRDTPHTRQPPRRVPRPQLARSTGCVPQQAPTKVEAQRDTQHQINAPPAPRNSADICLGYPLLKIK